MKFSLFLIVIVLACAGAQAGAAPNQSAAEIRLPVTRDTWFSAVGKEANDNLGGAPRLKLKSIQEMSLVDFDPAQLKGHVITEAELHVHRIRPERLWRVTVGTFAADWVEGTSPTYAQEKGASTFNWRKFPDVPWAFPGSDLTAVMLGQGGTLWHSADASAPDGQDWQVIPIAPSVMAARAAGISYGCILFDDTGSEWTRQGEKFSLRNFPNRFVSSRDDRRAYAPYFTVRLGAADQEPPDAPTAIESDTANFPAGEAMASWITPADHGPAGTIGFLVEVDGKETPRYMIPAAGDAGQRVQMHLRDLGLKAGQLVTLNVRAVDAAGNISTPTNAKVTVSNQKIDSLPGASPTPFTPAGKLPKLGDAEIAIIDGLDKVQPITGQIIPDESPSYFSGNHLWDGNSIHLQAARNEFVAFQVLVHGPVHDLHASLVFHGKTGISTDFYRLRSVQTSNGPMPDALKPWTGTMSLPDPSEKLSGQQYGSIFCEVYIPFDAQAGDCSGELELTEAGKKISIPVSVHIWNFALPDELSFIPEMNCYGLPEDDLDYYRLAHRNRTVLNRVPYSQNGSIEPGCAPAWNAKTQSLDFSAWDRHFAPLFDGSAFSDQPRKTPIECFYLPLHENWPTPMEGNYNGSYWADQAFPAAYKEAFVAASREFAQHFNQKHWNQTFFQCFFNGKNNFKERGWSHGSSPWLLDEPANFQDYWALHFFGQLFLDGIAQAPGDARMLFRCDISRPEWQRDVLDSVLNYNVVAGGAFTRYHRIVMDRKREFHQLVIPYGTTNDPAGSNVQPAAWCLDSWTQGGDGVLPWQVIGNAESWEHGDATCLFYPGPSVGLKEPIASIRLKAYLRGEQDVEYLCLLAKQQHQSQLIFGQRVLSAIALRGRRQGTGFTGGEDAGRMTYSNLKPADLWALRTRVAQAISQ